MRIYASAWSFIWGFSSLGVTDWMIPCAENYWWRTWRPSKQSLSSLFLSYPFFFFSFCLSFQPNLYPTVGLQTPGEIVDANFGQQPFVFDIEDYMSEWRAKIHSMIARFPIGERLGDWQAVLQKWAACHLKINSAVTILIKHLLLFALVYNACMISLMWLIRDS